MRKVTSYKEDSTSEEEDNFADGLDFETTEEATDPLETVEVIQARRRLDSEINQTSQDLATTFVADRDEEAERAEHFSPVQVRFPVNAPALRPPPIMVDYDAEDGTDKADAMFKAITALKGYKWEPTDLNYYFNQVEIKMQTQGVLKQWTKLQVITTILPENVLSELKPILRKKESEFTDKNSYLLLKNEVLRIFGQPEEARFERAMGRVLTDQPSQLARALVDDLCDNELQGCCCRRTVGGLWKRQLPSGVVQAIADTPFDAANYRSVLQTADNVFKSTKRNVIPGVAAVAPPSFPGQFSDTGPTGTLDTAFHQSFPDSGQAIAAYSYGRGGGRGGRGSWRGQGQGQGRGTSRGQRGGRGGNQSFRGTGSARGGGGASGGNGGGAQRNAHPRHKTPRHADQPPWESCFRHWTHGKSAHFCMEPGTCPWKDFYIPKANN